MALIRHLVVLQQLAVEEALTLVAQMGPTAVLAEAVVVAVLVVLVIRHLHPLLKVITGEMETLVAVAVVAVLVLLALLLVALREVQAAQERLVAL
jgi:hypothetical protein